MVRYVRPEDLAAMPVLREQFPEAFTHSLVPALIEDQHRRPAPDNAQPSNPASRSPSISSNPGTSRCR